MTTAAVTTTTKKKKEKPKISSNDPNVFSLLSFMLSLLLLLFSVFESKIDNCMHAIALNLARQKKTQKNYNDDDDDDN